MKYSYIILGGGGHAKVLLEAFYLQGKLVNGYTTPDPEKSCLSAAGVTLLGDDRAILAYPPDSIRLINGLGSIKTTEKRKALFMHFKESGYCFADVVHPAVIVARDFIVQEGLQLMAGAVVQPGCRIGSNVLINTRASIDHDCTIADHVHIAPGAVLSGEVQVGEGSHLGTGCVILQGIRIGANCVVGAGAVVTRDVPDNAIVMGVPAVAR